MIESEGACAANEPFALQVLGDSMEPEFKDGCIIIIEPIQPGAVMDGAYVIAEQAGEYIFRQFHLINGKYWLKALNKKYFDVEIPNVLLVKGIIVQRAGKRRSESKHYEYTGKAVGNPLAIKIS